MTNSAGNFFESRLILTKNQTSIENKENAGKKFILTVGMAFKTTERVRV